MKVNDWNNGRSLYVIIIAVMYYSTSVCSEIDTKYSEHTFY